MAESIAEKILKRKKDAALQKQLQGEQIVIETTPENKTEAEIQAAVKQSRLQVMATKKRKKQFKQGLMVGGALFLGYAGYLLFKPYEADLTFGVCRIYLELSVQYPQTLHLSTVDEIRDYVRIWYTQVDAFGQYRMENIQCTFEADETMGFRLKKVSFNRREVDPAKVTEFNKILPVIFAAPPDLVYPTPLPDSLEDLQINTDMFRMPIL